MANCFSPPVGNRGVRVSGQSLSHRIVLFDGKRKAGERGGKKEGQSLRGHETIARVRHDSDANDLLALCASFLLLLFLPSFLPPSILLLRTHAHVTLPRYSRNQFLKPPNRSRDLRGDRRDPRSRSIRCARIPANRSPLQSDHLPYHLKYSKKRVKKQTCTKCRYRIADSKLILCLF